MNRFPGSQETFALSRSWEEQCLNHHATCPKPTLSFMPLRVLKVSSNLSTSLYQGHPLPKGPGIRRWSAHEYLMPGIKPQSFAANPRVLIEVIITEICLKCTENDGRFEVSIHSPSSDIEPYLALSYCWGGDQPHKTTRKEINSEQFDLAWDCLPPTIQDAVKVTTGMGHRFLWVDSLCIVQDDEVEKAQQIAVMPQIYHNATMTILASRSESALEGFLHERMGRPVTFAVKLPFRCPEGFCHSHGAKDGSVYAVHLEDELRPEPLDHRGWALQERYLSPRILDFGSEHVTWSCHSQNGTHQPTDGWKAFTGPEALLRPKTGISTLQLRDYKSLTMVPGSFSISESEFYYLVEIYSQRRLTFPSDRILAISGVASGFLSMHDDFEYKAGHWAKTLPRSLLWRVVQGQRRARPVEYQAPSWSWAAVNDAVDFFYMRLGRMTLEDLRLETHTELVDSSAPCGAVRHGRITGSGTILRALWFGRKAMARHPLHRLIEAQGPIDSHNVEQIPMMQMFPDAVEKEFSEEATEVPGLGEAIPVCLLLFAWVKEHMFPETYQLDGPVGLVLRELNDDSPANTNDAASDPCVRRFSRLGLFSIHRDRNRQGLKIEDADEYFEKLFHPRTREEFEIV